MFSNRYQISKCSINGFWLLLVEQINTYPFKPLYIWPKNFYLYFPNISFHIVAIYLPRCRRHHKCVFNKFLSRSSRSFFYLTHHYTMEMWKSCVRIIIINAFSFSFLIHVWSILQVQALSNFGPYSWDYIFWLQNRIYTL